MIDRTPLTAATLSPAAQKALGPGPARAMAARGLVPLPPAEQLAVLYQLSLDADASLAMSARNTAVGLPDRMLSGALADPAMDPRVLDLFAELVGEKKAAFEALAGNPAVADETIARLAARANAAEVDRIAANEQRLLRHPEIIAAMYTNKQARMSTVDRAVELAVRNNIRVPGLAAWDEIAAAIGSAPRAAAQDDALFASAVATLGTDDSVLTKGDTDQVSDEEEAPAVALPAQKAKVAWEEMTVPMKIRYATVGDAFDRARAVRDPSRIVAMAAIKSPAISEVEVTRIASNVTMAEDVVRYIASRREWTKLPSVRKALCRNPKTPIPDAMRLMPFLRENELTQISKSKGVPSAVVMQARKLLTQRRTGSTKR
jgi:hypothetical protein